MDAELLYMIAQEGKEVGNPYIIAYRNGTVNGISSSLTPYIVNYNTVSAHDSISGGFSASNLQSNGSVLIPVTGLYAVTVNYSPTSLSSNTYVNLGIAVSSSSTSTTTTNGFTTFMASNTMSSNAGLNFSTLVVATGGNFISAIVAANAGSIAGSSGGLNGNFISISYIGPA